MTDDLVPPPPDAAFNEAYYQLMNRLSPGKNARTARVNLMLTPGELLLLERVVEIAATDFNLPLSYKLGTSIRSIIFGWMRAVIIRQLHESTNRIVSPAVLAATESVKENYV